MILKVEKSFEVYKYWTKPNPAYQNAEYKTDLLVGALSKVWIKPFYR